MVRAKQNGKQASPATKKGAKGKQSPTALSPFSFVGRVMEEVDRLAGDVGYGRELVAAVDRNLPGGAWVPKVEVVERNGELIFRADVPGLTRDDVKVTFRNGMLEVNMPAPKREAGARRKVATTEKAAPKARAKSA